MLELKPAFLLDVGLFDRVHVALELRDLLGACGVALNEEQRGPKQDHAYASRYSVVVCFLVLSAAGDCGARGHAGGFLLKLGTRVALVLDWRDIGSRDIFRPRRAAGNGQPQADSQYDTHESPRPKFFMTVVANSPSVDEASGHAHVL